MAKIAGKVAIVPRGAWNEDADYDILNLVYDEGNSFICKKPNSGIKPVDGEYWQLLPVKVTTDTEFSTESENPVQNKVITGAIGDLEDLPYEGKNIVESIVELDTELANTSLTQASITGIAWAINTDYSVNNVRVYENKVYRCKLAHTSSDSILPTNGDYWELTSLEEIEKKISSVNSSLSGEISGVSNRLTTVENSPVFGVSNTLNDNIVTQATVLGLPIGTYAWNNGGKTPVKTPSGYGTVTVMGNKGSAYKSAIFMNSDATSFYICGGIADATSVTWHKIL